MSGIIGPLGEWIIGEACRQGQRWHDEGLPPLTIAVNVSPRQFQLTDLVGCIASALKETGYSAALLELEITESAPAELARNGAPRRQAHPRPPAIYPACCARTSAANASAGTGRLQKSPW